MVAAALQSPGPPGLFGFTAIPHLKYNGCLNIDKTAFDAVVLAASGPFKQKGTFIQCHFYFSGVQYLCYLER